MKPVANHRPETVVAHETAVRKIIRHMRANLVEWESELSLDHLAREGCYSKAHLIEIFDEVTGTTPHHFLASLRIQMAKELLLKSNASATDIALEVGYQSFPTFSRTFTDYVGISPLEFRKAPKFLSASELAADATSFIAKNYIPASCKALEGRVKVPVRSPGLVFVGTFTRGIPQGRPDSGTVLLEPGFFRIRKPATQKYHLLAALLPWQTCSSSPCHTITPALVASRRNVNPEDGSTELILRPLCTTDPPLVVSLIGLLR